MVDHDFSGIRIEEICRIVQIDIKEGVSKTMSDRTSEGILIATKGTLEYTHNSQTYRSDPNHILIVPKGISYKFTSRTDSTSIVINFNLKEPLPFHTFCSIKDKNTEFASKMEKLWTFRKEGFELSCLSILYNFFAKLCIDSTYLPASQLKLIQPGIRYMEEHLLDLDLRDEQLAKECNISKTYFRNIFIKKYDVPPMRYVRQRKIERAKQILDSGYYNLIMDVATEAGFSDIYVFCKAFKKETGMTPSEYVHLSR